MEKSFDLMSETDPGKNPDQLALLSVDESGGTVDINPDAIPEVTDITKETSETSECAFCDLGIDTNDESTYKEIRAWVHGPKKDSAVLRIYTGLAAHSDCIAKLRAGIAADQQELGELLEMPARSSEATHLFTDRSEEFKLGFDDGLAGISWFGLGEPTADYIEGHDVGTEQRESPVRTEQEPNSTVSP